MLAKAAATVVAKLHGVDTQHSRFIKINGPEIQSPFVGQTEAIIRRIFAYAKAYKALHGHPLTIFIDEADALLPSRDGRGSRPPLPWEETQVAAFLAEMDGLADCGAFVMLATNRPHAIDAAALRDGRCDRKITVVRPNRSAATIIFNRSMAGVPLAEGHALPVLSDMVIENFFSPLRKLIKIVHDKGNDFLTLGDIVNGAMIVSLVERAKEHAMRRDIAAGGNPSGVSSKDFDDAIDALTKENVGTIDHYAIMEFCQRTGIEQLSFEAITAGQKIPNVKRAGLH
jgi:SpoVK/Ycf46/Vps4 family AAA+-type ATPase